MSVLWGPRFWEMPCQLFPELRFDHRTLSRPFLVLAYSFQVPFPLNQSFGEDWRKPFPSIFWNSLSCLSPLTMPHRPWALFPTFIFMFMYSSHSRSNNTLVRKRDKPCLPSGAGDCSAVKSALPEKPSFVPSTHVSQLSALCKSSSRDPGDPMSLTARAPACMHTY